MMTQQPKPISGRVCIVYVVMMTLCFVAITYGASKALGAELPSIGVVPMASLTTKAEGTKAEGQAWCNGYQLAIALERQNRDRFMRMDPDFKFETPEEAYKRIYATPWEQQHKTNNIVHNVISIMRDSVDLYVVPPAETVSIDTKDGGVICDPLDLSSLMPRAPIPNLPSKSK